MSPITVPEYPVEELLKLTLPSTISSPARAASAARIAAELGPLDIILDKPDIPPVNCPFCPITPSTVSGYEDSVHNY